MQNEAAVLYAARSLRIEQWPMPEPRPGDLVVEINAVGICGSDVHYYQYGQMADNVVSQPVVLGHESAGRIVQTSDTDSRFALGDRVTIEPQRPCGRCRWCWSGAYNMCRTMEFLADPPTHGALTRFLSVPAAFCHPVPDTMTDDEAALIEPLAVGLWGARKVRVTAGDHVLVSGAGPIGLLAAQCAVALGATRVVVADTNAARAEFAERFRGVSGYQIESSNYEGLQDLDVVLECSGAPGALMSTSRLLSPGGRIAAIGIGRQPVAELDIMYIQSHELEMHGVYRYAGMYPSAIELVASRTVDAATLITHRFDLQHAEDALTIAEREPAAIKAIVRPNM